MTMAKTEEPVSRLAFFGGEPVQVSRSWLLLLSTFIPEQKLKVKILN